MCFNFVLWNWLPRFCAFICWTCSVRCWTWNHRNSYRRSVFMCLIITGIKCSILSSVHWSVYYYLCDNALYSEVCYFVVMKRLNHCVRSFCCFVCAEPPSSGSAASCSRWLADYGEFQHLLWQTTVVYDCPFTIVAFVVIANMTSLPGVLCRCAYVQGVRDEEQIFRLWWASVGVGGAWGLTWNTISKYR